MSLQPQPTGTTAARLGFFHHGVEVDRVAGCLGEGFGVDTNEVEIGLRTLVGAAARPQESQGHGFASSSRVTGSLEEEHPRVPVEFTARDILLRDLQIRLLDEPAHAEYVVVQCRSTLNVRQIPFLARSGRMPKVSSQSL